MRAVSGTLVGPLALAVLATAYVPRATAAQSTRRDTARTIIIDSVRKTGSIALASQTPRTSSPELSRTVDAEVRVAMFELTLDEPYRALSRLDRVSAVVSQDSTGIGEAERAALHFLLSQTYYRVGMLAAFRREAEGLAAGSTRYASVLRAQLLVEAYRSGDYARVATLSRTRPTNDATGLSPLVTGLAAYRSGDLAGARRAFAQAGASNGPFASYAKYMDALTQVRSDTARAANTLASLEAVANGTTGAFADQVRLTAAQVAYEGRRYEDAVRIAAAISDSSQLAAPALFTRAWALYKLERTELAERAFSDFGTRYPHRAESDEARLMAAQAQLELGRSADAERVFQRVADSSSSGIATLQAQTNAAIAELARALVTSRSTEMLVVGDPNAKVLVLRDSSSNTDLLAALSAPPSATVGGLTAMLAVPDAARLDSIAVGVPTVVTRVLLTPASAAKQTREVAQRSQSLVAVDAAVAVARLRLSEQLEAQQREIALLTQLGGSLAADSSQIGAMALNYQTLADSMARLDQLLSTAEARVRDMVGREIAGTRSLAAENAKTADSLRSALASRSSPEDRAALDAEVATAAAYAKIADLAATGLDSAIAHHPAFVARGALRTRDASARAVLAAMQSSYAGSRGDVDAALVALHAGDTPEVQRARQALADAESRRNVAEGEAIAAVNAELSARAGRLIADLQRNTEAAQFGVASAAFFRAIDEPRAVGGTGSGGSSRSPAPDRRR
jgi:outer membrane protein assembly factor BamD (BamD/ComL family)